MDGAVISMVRFDGLTWGTPVSTSNTIQDGSYSSLVAVGDVVHVVYSKGNKDIVYQNWTYAGNAWSTPVVIQGSVTASNVTPQISLDGDRLICVWLGHPQANLMYCSVREGAGGWSQPAQVGEANSTYKSNSYFAVSR